MASVRRGLIGGGGRDVIASRTQRPFKIPELEAIIH